jgi:predicted RNA-binding protein associated with RNAse of E/G family
MLNHWHPYIVFYDKHLNILKIIKKDNIFKTFNTNIPKGTNYIKITDLYMLLNIKRGLSVIIRKNDV